jgi:transporter family protein
MRATLLAILAGTFWGVGEFFTKQVLHTGRVGPVTAITVRSTVALPVLWLVYLLFVPGRGLEPRDWTTAGAGTLLKLVLGSGLVAGAAGMLCFYGALHLGPISKVKPIAFTVAPVIAVLLGWIALGEGMSVRKAAAVLLIVSGVVLLTAER